jgi:NTE family protein
MVTRSERKIGLILHGGVARGFAHIGVLKVIERKKIPVHCIVATSSGAIAGAYYASGMGVSRMEEVALEFRWRRLLRPAFARRGLFSVEPFRKIILKHMGDKDFSELRIPLAVVTTDVKTAESVVFRQGSLPRVLAASNAFPSLFVPGKIGDRHLVDGGLGTDMPISTAKKMGANFTIGVATFRLVPASYLPKNAIQMYNRCFDILMHRLIAEQKHKADIMIEPVIEDNIWALNPRKIKRLIAAGEEAAERALRSL